MGASQANTALHERSNPRGDKSSYLTSPPAPTPAGRGSGPASTPNSSNTTNAISSPDDTRGRQPDTISSGTKATKKDYWRLAAEKLQEEDTSVTDQIAGVQRAALESGSTDFAAQLLRVTKQSQQTLEAKRWKITTRSREVVLRDQLDRLLKVVTVLKDIGKAAGSIDPVHAGLPLAGFCVLMQVRPTPFRA
jgi:hypothetical protein